MNDETATHRTGHMKGQTNLLRHTVTGMNTASNSNGSIHDDEIAHQRGFEGGLVPGVNVISHMCHLPLQRWGDGWLETGSIDFRLSGPAYHGETIEITGQVINTPTGETVEIAVTAGGRNCAKGVAVETGNNTEYCTGDYRFLPLPPLKDRPVYRGSEIPVGTTLGCIEDTYSLEKSRAAIERIGEYVDAFHDHEIAHPHLLLTHAIYSFVWSFKLELSIHTRCRVQFSELLREGEQFSTRGRITANYSFNGNQYVDYDHVVLTESGRVILGGRQSVIVQLRSQSKLQE